MPVRGTNIGISGYQQAFRALNNISYNNNQEDYQKRKKFMNPNASIWKRM